jgi:hypothetical protein
MDFPNDIVGVLLNLALDSLLKIWDPERADHLYKLILRLASSDYNGGKPFLVIETDYVQWIAGPALLATFAFLCFKHTYIKKEDKKRVGFESNRKLHDIFYDTFVHKHRENYKYFVLLESFHKGRLSAFDGIFKDL